MSFPDFFIIRWLNNNTLALLEEISMYEIKQKLIQMFIPVVQISMFRI